MVTLEWGTLTSHYCCHIIRYSEGRATDREGEDKTQQLYSVNTRNFRYHRPPGSFRNKVRRCQDRLEHGGWNGTRAQIKHSEQYSGSSNGTGMGRGVYFSVTAVRNHDCTGMELLLVSDDVPASGRRER